ncbi:hypothetical protein QBC46DRAFT_439747 [Diplogelasinospora grovesii]|uniref:Uncharacterized protein n=1 Tax=Diplogelasinospora grovesii TaxID=303347 RepID=A0AAN6N3V1_9PEZI|nr:hypothetical protein QBC46DRAFT_439747 [Diplogelasinospora grovesii]
MSENNGQGSYSGIKESLTNPPARRPSLSTTYAAIRDSLLNPSTSRPPASASTYTNVKESLLNPTPSRPSVRASARASVKESPLNPTTSRPSVSSSSNYTSFTRPSTSSTLARRSSVVPVPGATYSPVGRGNPFLDDDLWSSSVHSDSSAAASIGADGIDVAPPTSTAADVNPNTTKGKSAESPGKSYVAIPDKAYVPTWRQNAKPTTSMTPTTASAVITPSPDSNNPFLNDSTSTKPMAWTNTPQNSPEKTDGRRWARPFARKTTYAPARLTAALDGAARPQSRASAANTMPARSAARSARSKIVSAWRSLSGSQSPPEAASPPTIDVTPPTQDTTFTQDVMAALDLNAPGPVITSYRPEATSPVVAPAKPKRSAGDYMRPVTILGDQPVGNSSTDCLPPKATPVKTNNDQSPLTTPTGENTIRRKVRVQDLAFRYANDERPTGGDPRTGHFAPSAPSPAPTDSSIPVRTPKKAEELAAAQGVPTPRSMRGPPQSLETPNKPLGKYPTGSIRAAPTPSSQAGSASASRSPTSARAPLRNISARFTQLFTRPERPSQPTETSVPAVVPTSELLISDLHAPTWNRGHNRSIPNLRAERFVLTDDLKEFLLLYSFLRHSVRTSLMCSDCADVIILARLYTSDLLANEFSSAYKFMDRAVPCPVCAPKEPPEFLIRHLPELNAEVWIKRQLVSDPNWPETFAAKLNTSFEQILQKFFPESTDDEDCKIPVENRTTVWYFHLWYVTQGEYTLDDLCRGRDFLEFVEHHISRLRHLFFYPSIDISSIPNQAWDGPDLESDAISHIRSFNKDFIKKRGKCKCPGHDLNFEATEDSKEDARRFEFTICEKLGNQHHHQMVDHVLSYMDNNIVAVIDAQKAQLKSNEHWLRHEPIDRLFCLLQSEPFKDGMRQLVRMYKHNPAARESSVRPPARRV